MSVERPGRVVVLGAGGRTGRAVLDASLRAGRSTVAVVRSPARADIAPRDGLTVAEGDARDPAALRRVIDRGDAVISVVGAPGRHSHDLFRDVARAVVAATEGTVEQRFVGVTSSGVHHDDPGHPWWYRRLLAPLMRRTYADMAVMEQTVAASSLRWTFIRPGRLLDTPAGHRYRVLDGSNPPGGTSIPREDVAGLAVACVVDGAWTYQRPTVTR